MSWIFSWLPSEIKGGICCISNSAMRLQKSLAVTTKSLTPEARRELLLQREPQSDTELAAGQHVEQPARQPPSKASKHASAGECPPEARQYVFTQDGRWRHEVDSSAMQVPGNALKRIHNFVSQSCMLFGIHTRCPPGAALASSIQS